ncbi:MAG: HNH endonuclease [Eggerthellaceae bacterium]|nr:HNH endonuclease [Eggerthellaceae bacterium]
MTSKYRRFFAEEENAFLRDVIPGRTWREVSAMFDERFGRVLKQQCLYDRARKLGVRFGQKGAPGNIPTTSLRVPVGTEKVDDSGYVVVKVSAGKAGNPVNANKGRNRRCWRLKHHLVWEKAHGKPVPEGHMVVFANHDNRDFTPENIVAVPRSAMGVIHRMRMEYYDAESLALCVAIAQVRMNLKAKKKQLREGAKR